MAYTTIKKPSDYFNTKLYSGSGSVQTISGVGFEPSFTWIKNRSYTHNHVLANAVRGSNKSVNSNTTDTETEDSANGYIMSFNSDGFVLDGSNYGWTNNNSSNYVSWNWKASGSGSANTDGSINSTVSANTTSGVSVVSYQGTGSASTIGHGLGSAPKMIIIKNLSASAKSFQVGHEGIGWGNGIYLNLTDGQASDSGAFNSTAPTSSVFSVGTSSLVNDSGNNYICYCFSEVRGFSKFGSYTGAGSNLPFIYTGFKPAWLMVKRTDSTASWIICDNKRDIDNPIADGLYANTNEATNSGTRYDFLSNGIKMRSTYSESNASSATYIYIAFAEEPLVGDNPATAR